MLMVNFLEIKFAYFYGYIKTYLIFQIFHKGNNAPGGSSAPVGFRLGGALKITISLTNIAYWSCKTLVLKNFFKI